MTLNVSLLGSKGLRAIFVAAICAVTSETTTPLLIGLAVGRALQRITWMLISTRINSWRNVNYMVCCRVQLIRFRQKIG